MLLGTGSELDPWRVYDEDGFVELLHQPSNAYLGHIWIMNHLDFTDYNLTEYGLNSYPIDLFDGRGHHIKNITYDISNGVREYFISHNSQGIIRRCVFDGFRYKGSGGSVSWYSPFYANFHIEDVITLNGFPLGRYPIWHKEHRRVLEVHDAYKAGATTSKSYESIYSLDENSRITDLRDNGINRHNVKLRRLTERSNIDNFPEFRDRPHLWSHNANSDNTDRVWDLIPIRQSEDFPRTLVRGTTTILGKPKGRDVVVLDADNMLTLARGVSDLTDGTFELEVTPKRDKMVLFVYDSLGRLLSPNQNYSLGDYMHLHVSNGYRYECVFPGTTDGDIPNNLPIEDDTLITIGTARFIPKRVNKPDIGVNITAEIEL